MTAVVVETDKQGEAPYRQCGVAYQITRRFAPAAPNAIFAVQESRVVQMRPLLVSGSSGDSQKRRER